MSTPLNLQPRLGLLMLYCVIEYFRPEFSPGVQTPRIFRQGRLHSRPCILKSLSKLFCDNFHNIDHQYIHTRWIRFRMQAIRFAAVGWGVVVFVLLATSCGGIQWMKAERWLGTAFEKQYGLWRSCVGDVCVKIDREYLSLTILNLIIFKWSLILLIWAPLYCLSYNFST